MRQVFGGLLMAVGILVGGLSGLCMAFGVGMIALDPGSSSEMGGILPLILMVGGVPFVAGIGLFFAGHSLLRPRAGSGTPPPLPPAAAIDPATMARPRLEDDHEL